MWDVSTGQHLAKYRAHRGPVTDVHAIDGQSHMFITSGMCFSIFSFQFGFKAAVAIAVDDQGRMGW